MLRCLMPSKGDCVTFRSSRDLQQVTLAVAHRTVCHSTNTNNPSPHNFRDQFGIRLALTSSKQRV